MTNEEWGKTIAKYVMNFRKPLDDFATEFGTDKGPQGHAYTQYYHMFFNELRDKPIQLLEIGIWEGASLKMWQDYFSIGRIVGADIYEKRQYDTDRITTVRLDQSKAKNLSKFGHDFRDYFDIIIDDGSHESEDQILSFNMLFPELKSGGFYCIEDTLCGYDKERWGKNANVNHYIKLLVGDASMNGKMSNYHICANKKEEVKKYQNLTRLEETIEWVFVSAGLTIIKKL